MLGVFTLCLVHKYLELYPPGGLFPYNNMKNLSLCLLTSFVLKSTLSVIEICMSVVY